MALFSFRHSVRTFSPKRSKNERAAEHGQTVAHLRYITRPSAARVILRARVGDDAEVARAAEQAAEKRGGRVAERFILALPVEATGEQRAALAQAFAEGLTQGIAGYVLAIHDARGNDARNPHCHLVAFDAFQKSGGRGRPRSVMGMAREGAVERVAALWARLHNEHMDAWGYGAASRITNLSLAARGIDQVPTIHEGAAARKMTARGAPMPSKDPWQRIDAGHTRAMANRIIREINQLKGRDDDDDRGDGLGGGHDGRAPERGEGGDARGTVGGRGGGDASPPEPPFIGPRRRDEDAGAHRRPPFVADRGGQGDTQRPRPAIAVPTPAPAPLAVPGPLRGAGGPGRVRRVFVELMMLRDTLRARVALVARTAATVAGLFDERIKLRENSKHSKTAENSVQSATSIPSRTL
jgi:hypothetical protein